MKKKKIQKRVTKKNSFPVFNLFKISIFLLSTLLVFFSISPSLAQVGLMNGRFSTGITDDYLFWLQTATDATPPIYTDLFYIDKQGQVGIGTSTPDTKLSITGESGVSINLNGSSIEGLALMPIEDDYAASKHYVDTNFISSSTLPSINNAFVQGGNAFGAPANLGTTDNQRLAFLTNNTEKMTILDNGHVGIGTSAPNEQLEITKNFRLPATSGTTPYGIIYKDGNRFIHDFNYGLNGNGITTDGYNTFVGINAGNLTMGSTATTAGQASYNTGIGSYSLYSNTTGVNNTANGSYSLFSNTTGNNNTANGYYSLYSNTTGSHNTANGYYSLYSNTKGYNNTANGVYSLYSNTTGSLNTANGYASLRSNTTGVNNTANGSYSLYSNTKGSYNTANGYYSLYSNTTGSYNTALGFYSGHFLADGKTGRSTGNNGLYLGYNSMASADGTDNEIVIGYNTIGNGSNTATYGNTLMTKHIFSDGNVGIGTTTITERLTVDGNVEATGFFHSSDARLKENVKTLSGALAKIRRMNPVEFRWKEGGELSQGFIAQELELIVPELVKTNSVNGLKSVEYANLTALLTAGIKEQDRRIEQLEAEIAILKIRLNNLEK